MRINFTILQKSDVRVSKNWASVSLVNHNNGYISFGDGQLFLSFLYH